MFHTAAADRKRLVDIDELVVSEGHAGRSADAWDTAGPMIAMSKVSRVARVDRWQYDAAVMKIKSGGA